ncbi:sensor histidine kinase [Antarctobacter jejuensis]|uniref:sensor histidine kinase n=1 Tax=Antarctobacter jejuensis TaxID=1439938 RepID=UPI003FD0ED70
MRDVSPSGGEFDSYLYAITHDLKSYSRAMRVIPDWVVEDLAESETALPGDVSDHLSMLQHYARGMDRMLDGLTELSRVGRLADAPSARPLREALERTWAEVADREGFSADFSGVADMVNAPENDLHRLLFAVLSNAVQHHDHDRGQVRAVSRRAGDRVILEISDDGPGIDPAYRAKVFEPLHTLFPKDETGFSGLGLTVARKVVVTLGGEIAVTDTAGGRGCTIQCDLPAG